MRNWKKVLREVFTWDLWINLLQAFLKTVSINRNDVIVIQMDISRHQLHPYSHAIHIRSTEWTSARNNIKFYLIIPEYVMTLQNKHKQSMTTISRVKCRQFQTTTNFYLILQEELDGIMNAMLVLSWKEWVKWMLNRNSQNELTLRIWFQT